MCSTNSLSRTRIAIFVALLAFGTTLHAQNRTDYFNILQKSVQDMQRAEEQAAAERRAQAAASQQRALVSAAQQARQQQQAQAQQTSLAERQQVERRVASLRAELATKKQELEDLKSRKRQQEQLAQTPNPWATQ